jgi:hypothetical protein
MANGKGQKSKVKDQRPKTQDQIGNWQSAISNVYELQTYYPD